MPHEYYQEASHKLLGFEGLVDLHTLLHLKMEIWPPLSKLHLTKAALLNEIQERRQFISFITTILSAQTYQHYTSSINEIINNLQTRASIYFYDENSTYRYKNAYSTPEKMHKIYELAIAIIQEDRDKILELSDVELNLELVDLIKGYASQSVKSLIESQKNETIEEMEERLQRYPYYIDLDYPECFTDLSSSDKERLLTAIITNDLEFLKQPHLIYDEDCMRAAIRRGEPVLSLVKKKFYDTLIGRLIDRNMTIDLYLINNCTVDDFVEHLKHAINKDSRNALTDLLNHFRPHLRDKNLTLRDIILMLYKEDPSIFIKLEKMKSHWNYEPYLNIITEMISQGDLELMQAMFNAGFSFERYPELDFTESLQSLGVKNIKALTPMLRLLIYGFKYKPNLKTQRELLTIYEKNPTSQEYLEFGFNPHAQKMEGTAVRVGHILGLSESFTFFNLNETKDRWEYSIDVEGNLSFKSLSFLNEKLELYQNELSGTDKKDFNDILEAFQFMQDLYELSGSSLNTESAAAMLRLRYNAQLLTHIVSGWGGHSVGLTLYKGYLIYCNRGDFGDQKFGTKIYKINKGITKEWIKQILKTTSFSEFNQLLYKVIEDPNQPVAKFPAKGQKHGTCSYVNKLSSTEGMLCLLEAERRNELTDSGISKISKEMNAQRIEGKYKNFTKFCRNSEIELLINNMKVDVASDPRLINFYYLLFKKIILSHHGKTENPQKSENEKEMAKQLYLALPESLQIKMNEELANKPEILEILKAKLKRMKK